MKYIYISIEVFDREIHGAIDLSKKAIQNNFEIILGDRQSLMKNLCDLPPGILFYKSASRIDEVFYNAFHKSGHHLICLDAEGLITYNFDYFFKYRLTNKNINLLSYYFLWGKNQYQIALKKFPNYKDKFFVSGGLTALNWQTNLNKNKDKIEKNLVFFTSFGPFNHFLSNQDKNHLQKKIYNLDANDSLFLDNYVKYIKVLFYDYLKLIPIIADQIFPNNLYIKIHPSENPLPWKNLTKSNKNIIINEDSPTAELIHNSTFIIQSESSTSVESTINNKKVFSYIPKSYMKSTMPLEIPKEYQTCFMIKIYL